MNVNLAGVAGPAIAIGLIGKIIRRAGVIGRQGQ